MVETDLDRRLQLRKDVFFSKGSTLEFRMSHYSSLPQMTRHRAYQMEKHAAAQKQDIIVQWLIYKCL